MKLVIVESPTKAKTISKFLGKNFVIESSYGHVRDLPKKELGIDVENDFKPKYVIFKANQKRITALRKKAEKADTVYFATDEDREGEAISWHLQQIFKLPEEKIKRIAFHEITKEAILESLKNPRSIDLNMVDAQQARRVLDRLVGYKLSPFLWKKVARGLSAGRVQSVAVRLIVEREREIENFKSDEYWSIEAEFESKPHPSDDHPQGDKTQNLILRMITRRVTTSINAQLHKIGDKTLKKLDIKTKDEADKILKDLKGADYEVLKIDKKEIKKSPLPPFTTSTLQQTANNKLGFSAKQTMMLAQQLYEGIKLGENNSAGLITYMRTDSFNLSEKFLTQAQKFIKKSFGEKYSLTHPRRFKTKSKTAQEAHEAIRPTDATLEPEKIKQYLDNRQFKLYQLIWQRAIACQMTPAIIDSTIVDITTQGFINTGSSGVSLGSPGALAPGHSHGQTPVRAGVLPDSNEYIFRTTGSIIKFDGFLKVYPIQTEENILPPLKTNEPLELIKLNSLQHFTQPPARYTEASLVKTLEKYGIGRPSTYAPIISTIQTRNYVLKEEKKLKPTEIGILVNDILVKHFPKIVDYKFTAELENNLDKIAEGKIKWTTLIDNFYKPFIKNLEEKNRELTKKELTQEEETQELCPKCGKPLIIKMGRYGKFLACSNFPECKFTKPLEDLNKEEEKLTKEKCPKCGHPLIIKHGRYGKFLACSNYPECKFTKPIIKSTGVKCPECGKGEIIEKRTKTGRTFYACSKYPDCKFALWSKPTGEKCPKCGSLLVYGAKQTIKCSNKECDFSKPADK